MRIITRQLMAGALVASSVSPAAGFVSTRCASRTNICDNTARPLLATTAAIANNPAVADAKLKIHESM